MDVGALPNHVKFVHGFFFVFRFFIINCCRLNNKLNSTDAVVTTWLKIMKRKKRIVVAEPLHFNIQHVKYCKLERMPLDGSGKKMVLILLPRGKGALHLIKGGAPALQ